jgi:hypothetical protein
MLSGGGRGPPFGGTHSMQDLMRDWRRWRIEERVVAILVFGLVMSTPLVFAIATLR